MKSVQNHDSVRQFLSDRVQRYPITEKDTEGKFHADFHRIWNHLTVDGEPLLKSTEDGLMAEVAASASPEAHDQLSKRLVSTILGKNSELSTGARQIYVWLIRYILTQAFYTMPTYQLIEFLPSGLEFGSLQIMGHCSKFDVLFSAGALYLRCRVSSQLHQINSTEAPEVLTGKNGKPLQLSVDTVYRFIQVSNHPASQGIVECGIVESVLKYPKAAEERIRAVLHRYPEFAAGQVEDDHPQSATGCLAWVWNVLTHLVLCIQNLFRIEKQETNMESPVRAAKYANRPVKGVPVPLFLSWQEDDQALGLLLPETDMEHCRIQGSQAVQAPVELGVTSPDEAEFESQVPTSPDSGMYEPRINLEEGLKATPQMSINSASFWSPISESHSCISDASDTCTSQSMDASPSSDADYADITAHMETIDDGRPCNVLASY